MLLADLAIRRPVSTTMAIAAVLVFGLVSLKRLGTDLFPKVDFPVVSVVSVLPGADPATVETEVSEPIEEAVATISAIKSLRSISADAVSQVIIEFELGKDIDVAFQEVTAKLSGVRRQLPRDLEEPVIEKMDVDAAPIMAVVVSGPQGVGELTRLADTVVKTRLQQVPNVGGVRLIGGREREMRIVLDRERLEGRHLTVDDVRTALGREQADWPGGRVEAGPRELIVSTKAECRTADEFGALVVAWRDGAPVRLAEVCTRIDDGLEDERSLSQLGGERAVSLLVRRQSGTNTLDVSRAVDAQLAKLSAELEPMQVRLVAAQKLAPFIELSLHEIQFHLLIGGLLAVLIVFLVLRSWRITLISACAIPVSVIGAFSAMLALGFNLNVMTMLALSLSIGILIDDAIVVVENIFRHYEEGDPALEAARKGTAEIGPAAVAITASIIAVFVPVAFMQGMVGRFFYQFGLTVAGAVLLSLLVAFTLAPMLAARLLPRRRHAAHRLAPLGRPLERLLDVIDSGYRRLLALALRQRLATVALALLALVAAVAVSTRLRSEFGPREDQSEFTIRVKAPLGSALATTEALCARIRDRLAGQPWLDYTFTTIGAGELQRVNEAEIYVKLLELDVRRARGLPRQLPIEAWVREQVTKIEGARISVEEVARISGGGWRNVAMQLELRGPDLAALATTADQVMARMAREGGYIDVDSSYEVGKPELHVLVRRDRAADLGVPTTAIATAIRTLIGGEDAARFTAGGDRYDVTLRLDERQRAAAADLLALSVRSQSGLLVPLRDLIEVREVAGPVQIERANRSRQITIYTNLNDGAAQGRTVTLGEAKDELRRFAVEAGLPPGATVHAMGMAEIMEESFASLGFTLLLAVVMVYLVLASQFESFIHPLTIMLSLPLSAVGALGLLVATGSTQSIFTMIGIIMLMGLVTKNAILLVDYTNTLRRRDGLDRLAAQLQAGPVRLRPILMTTLAMIFGMLPIAVGQGAGSESRAPMALTVIGGLITSTVLTLVVVPAVYSLFDDLGAWLRRLVGAGPSGAGPRAD